MAKEDEIIRKLDALSQKIDRQSLTTKPILNVEEACCYVGISLSYMYKLTAGKIIPHYCPMGKIIWFKREELDDWLLRNRQYTIDEIDQRASEFTISTRNGSIKKTFL